MTFSELLDLDKTASQTVATSRPATSGRAQKARAQKARAQRQASHHEPVAETTVVTIQETIPPGQRETEKPRHHATMVPAMLRQVRQAVRRIGKEAATYRFTREEKDKLAETIYTEGRAGIRTCENEIVRIAVNWLLEDQRARGEISVLAQALKALRE
ncbi:MAG: hypothetical protein ACYCZF_18265 [Anaerolineae bacterium]